VKPEKEDAMLVTIDKRGSINLPASLRKDLGVGPGTHLELTVDAGGAIVLFPVEIYHTVRLSDASRPSRSSWFKLFFFVILANS